MYEELNEYMSKLITYKGITDVCCLKYHSGGKARYLQIKDIERYFKLDKFGTKYLVVKKYDIPLEKIDGRKNSVVGDRKGNKGGNNHKHFQNYIIDRKFDKHSGVYCIAIDNKIYVGSTACGFRKRFLDHNGKNVNQPHTKQLTDSGALFQTLWISDIDDEYIIREVEQMYIDYFMANPEWEVINIKEETNCTREKTNYKYKTIKVDERQYELAMSILLENGILINKK